MTILKLRDGDIHRRWDKPNFGNDPRDNYEADRREEADTGSNKSV